MTRPRLKPLAGQTLVITGASSGHGLATARKAAKAGAKVVLVARNASALAEAVAGIQKAGGLAMAVVADVGKPRDIQGVVDQTLATFGGFDTWVNNAGVGIYASLENTPEADHAQLFQTNYWGVVHGSLAALKHFRAAERSGAIINVGSIQSDMASPLLGAYNASKHAVKGFTDSLRIELLAAGVPVSVTLIKPGAIGTPFPGHGRNLTGFKARLPQPLYAPELVADAILHAARNPRRAITVGAAGRLQVMAANTFPSLFDRVAGFMIPSLVDRKHPVAEVRGNLYAPLPNDAVRTQGDQAGRPVSVYTAAQTHPRLASALVVGALLLAVRARARLR